MHLVLHEREEGGSPAHPKSPNVGPLGLDCAMGSPPA
jgi:hypothetical protein